MTKTVSKEPTVENKLKQKDCPTHSVRARLHLLFTQLLESIIRLHVRSFQFGVTPATLERQTAELMVGLALLHPEHRWPLTPSSGLRHPSLEESAGNRCSGCEVAVEFFFGTSLP